MSAVRPTPARFLRLPCSARLRITCLDDKHIVKSAPIEYLRGELHFYRSIPAELTGLFPKLIEANDDPSLALPSITITKARIYSKGAFCYRVGFSHATRDEDYGGGGIPPFSFRTSRKRFDGGVFRGITEHQNIKIYPKSAPWTATLGVSCYILLT